MHCQHFSTIVHYYRSLGHWESSPPAVIIAGGTQRVGIVLARAPLLQLSRLEPLFRCLDVGRLLPGEPGLLLGGLNVALSAVMTLLVLR